MLVLVVNAAPPLPCHDLFSPSLLFFFSWNFGSLMETLPRSLVPTLRSHPPLYGHSAKIALIDNASLVAYPQNTPSLLRGAVGLITVPSMTPPPFPPFDVGDVF
jgi:hypothetical protein